MKLNGEGCQPPRAMSGSVPVPAAPRHTRAHVWSPCTPSCGWNAGKGCTRHAAASVAEPALASSKHRQAVNHQLSCSLLHNNGEGRQRLCSDWN